MSGLGRNNELWDDQMGMTNKLGFLFPHALLPADCK